MWLHLLGFRVCIKRLVILTKQTHRQQYELNLGRLQIHSKERLLYAASCLDTLYQSCLPSMHFECNRLLQLSIYHFSF